MQDFVKDLPVNLKSEIGCIIYQDVLEHCPFFQVLSFSTLSQR